MSDEMSQRSVRVAVSRIVLKYLMPVIAQHLTSRSFEQTIFLLPPTTHFKVLMSVRTEHLMWRSFDQAKFFCSCAMSVVELPTLHFKDL